MILQINFILWNKYFYYNYIEYTYIYVHIYHQFLFNCSWVFINWLFVYLSNTMNFYRSYNIVYSYPESGLILSNGDYSYNDSLKSLLALFWIANIDLRLVSYFFKKSSPPPIEL